MSHAHRRPQVCVLGSAEPGSRAFELAGQAGEALANLGVTVVSGCGSPATRVAAERAIQAGGLVLSIVPPDQMPPSDWPATVVIPCGMGDARNLLMALAVMPALSSAPRGYEVRSASGLAAQAAIAPTRRLWRLVR
jgi:predicted Rossmann-fold nucleotide-binding protein